MSDDRLVRLRRSAVWLDEGIPVPGTRLRIGLDPILGVVPGFGDAAGAVLAAWIVAESIRRGVSRYTLGRIAFNIAVDAILGAVPLVGDLFDVAWKANLRNVAIIERHVSSHSTSTKADRLFVVALCGSLILLCGALMIASVVLAAWLVGVVAG